MMITNKWTNDVWSTDQMVIQWLELVKNDQLAKKEDMRSPKICLTNAAAAEWCCKIDALNGDDV